MPQIVGQRTTSTTITETRQVRQVDQEMAELQPNVAPLVTLLNKMKGKMKPAKSFRLEWFEDDYVADWAQNSGATVNANASSTTITVTDGTLWVKGDIGAILQAASSANQPERFRVVSVAGNVLTVVRNVGSTGLRQLDADASILILGQAHEEGDTPVSAKTTQKVPKISYTEIFKKYLEFTRTELQSGKYASGGNDRKQEQNKLMREFKIGMNKSFMFGAAAEDLSGGPNGKPIRTTMGLFSVISTNKYDANGLLTVKAFQNFSEMAFDYGSDTKLLIASPKVISAVTMWSKNHLRLEPNDKVYGIEVSRIVTGHGTWLLAKDKTLKNGIAGKNGMNGWAFSVDLDNIEPMALQQPRLSENVIADGRDGEVDEILGEVGLKIKLEKTHAWLYNAAEYES